MAMEKRGVVDENTPEQEKRAADKRVSLDVLENDTAKQLADKVKAATKNASKTE